MNDSIITVPHCFASDLWFGRIETVGSMHRAYELPSTPRYQVSSTNRLYIGIWYYGSAIGAFRHDRQLLSTWRLRVEIGCCGSDSLTRLGTSVDGN